MAGSSAIVGRERELEEIDAALDAVAAAAPVRLAVAGEPGMGKTRLLQELRRRGNERGQLVLAGSAAEFERDLPFAVWIDALDAYLASQELDGESGGWGADLAAVLPSLQHGRGGDSPEGAAEPYRAHRAMRSLLEYVARDQPVVLVLDDLHWADGASIQLIGSLLRRGPAAPVLLALAYRAGQVPERLAPALAQPDVRVLELGPLSEQQCAELTRPGTAAREVAAIYQESGGNPFYTLELARARVVPERSNAGDAMAARAGVPRVIAAALMAELQELSADAQTLLSAAAVAGDPFEPDLAYEIAGLDAGAGVSGLDELLDATLLRPTDVPARFAFRHPLVRRGVYEAAKGGWRLAAHARAAEALEARGSSAVARAHHVEQSASLGDAAAVALLLEAARDSAARSPAGTARWYSAALRLLPDGDRQGRLAALAGLAFARRSLGDHAGCCEALLAAIELAGPEQTELRVGLVAKCAASELFLGRHEEAHRRLVAAAAALDDDASPEAVVLLLSQAMHSWLAQDGDDATREARRAVAAARRLDDPGLAGEAAATLAHISTSRADIATAAAAHAEASALLEGLDDEQLAGRLDAVHRLSRASLHLERYEDAVRQAARAMRVARNTGQAECVPVLLGVLATSAYMLGRLEDAAEAQNGAVEAARLAGNDLTTCSLMSTTARIALMRGDVDEALRAGEESLMLMGPEGSGHIVTIARAQAALTMREAGRPAADAERLIEPAGGWALASLPAIWSIPHHDALTRLELAAGAADRAAEAARRAEAAAAELGLPVATALAQRARARVLLAGGSASAAAELASASERALDGAGARLEAARSRTLAGEATAAAGDRTAAVRLLRSAESALDACGAVRPRDEARRALRRLGARAEPRGPATAGETGLSSLTPRELEIAELVRDRRTNREIADTLFLSSKTVESHLRNIFVKLSASSRVEVARAMERERGDAARA